MDQKVRTEAIKVAVRKQLEDLWLDAPEEGNVLEFLRQAPERISKASGLAIMKAPCINGDGRVAGYLNRPEKVIILTETLSPAVLHFTLGHELGHWFLHPGKAYFRDFALSNPSTSEKRPVEEREADRFATLLTMPEKTVRNCYEELFGESGQLARDEDLPFWLSQSLRRDIDRDWLEAQNSNTRAKLVAELTIYRGRHRGALANHFGVSSTAMGLRLVELGLFE